MLVHFPIALLVIYSLIEIISWKKIRENSTWFYIRFSFLIFGVLFAFATLQTGNAAEENFKNASLIHLVSVHSWWAITTTSLFLVILIIYLLELFSNDALIEKRIFPRFVRKSLRKISKFIFRPVLLKILALAGILMMIITGSLGGAIVYGPDTDSLVKWIYHFFVGV